jgi:hypothetical protein
MWRSRDNETFNLLERVSADEFRYVDRDVQNGITYYYAVSALDFDGNESELSPENISDTPRPSGKNVTLNDFSLLPKRSGFDFSQPERGAIPWDSPTTDVYFGLTEIFSEFDVSFTVPYLYSDNLTEMQDMGYHEAFDEVDVSPFLGFTTEFVELIEGHVIFFILLTEIMPRFMLLRFQTMRLLLTGHTRLTRITRNLPRLYIVS